MTNKYKLLLFIILFLLVSKRVCATTIDPMTVEEQIIRADLIALVKVKTSGGFYSKCRILESVKGKPKKEIVFYTPPGPHGPYFPHDLVGELLVIYAYKTVAPTRITSTSSTRPNVLAARQLTHDYRLPLWQGKYQVQDEKQGRKRLEYAQSFLNLSPKEKKAFFIREQVAKLYGSLRVDSSTVISEQMRVVAFSKNRKRVMEAIGAVSEKELLSMGMHFLIEDGKVTFAMIEEARKETYGKGPNKYDTFSIEKNSDKTLSQWAALKKELLDKPLIEQDPYAHERVNGVEPYAKNFSENTLRVDENKYELFYSLLSQKPTTADLVKLDKNLREAKPDEIGRIASIYAKWGLSPPERLLAEMSAKVVQNQVNRGHGHVNDTIWHLFSFPVPKNAPVLATLLRSSDNKQDVSSKLSLLAFYGDRDARKTLEKRLSSVSKYNDHKFNSDKSIVASSDIYWEHEALLNYNEPLLVKIAHQNEFIRPKILLLLLKRGSEQSVREITPLFNTLSSEQRQDVFTSIDVERHLTVFKEQYSEMAPNAKLGCLLEIADNLGSYSSLGSMEMWFKKEAIPMIANTIKKDLHKDQKLILQGLWMLASTGHPDCGTLIEKYSKIIDEGERKKSGEILYIIMSTWAQNVKNKKRLVDLVSSKKIAIRVPALIYLMIVNEKKYVPSLVKLTGEDSLLSARAALALAERGRTNAFSGLLNLLSKQEESVKQNMNWRIIQQRVNVLFSNATGGKTNGMQPKELAEYWAANKDRLKILDPWRANWDHCFCE